MRTIKLSEIKINKAFTDSIPTESKMEECRRNWNNLHKQDRYIVINHDGYLIDGYIQYLVLKENGVEDAEIKISHCKKKRWYRKNTEDWKTPRYREVPTTYIFGIHPNSNCKREFCWRVPESWDNWVDNIQIGDTIVCATRFGYSPVEVTRVEILDVCPVDLRVKKVVKKEIRRNGLVVEI